MSTILNKVSKMSSNTDSRGVQRGDCNFPQCDCDQYDGGTEGRKCNYCGHPPGKHVNMNTGIASLAPTTTSFLPSSSFHSTMVMDDTKFPSTQSQPCFDLNTGVDVQDGYSPQFTDHSAPDQSTMSMSPQGAVQPPPSQFDIMSSILRSPFKRPRPTTAPPPALRSPAPQLALALPLDQQCKLSGCSRRRYIEPGGRVHDCCGKTHATEYDKQNCHITSELQCKTPGCYKQRHPNDQGGHFDYCAKYCRDSGGKPQGSMLASASMPDMALTGGYGICQFPQCARPKYYDPANGRVHDFCGRSHAYQARVQGITTAVNIRVATAQELSTIAGKFKQSWASAKGACPAVSFVYIISNSQLTQRWATYRNGLQKKDVEEYYHGTKLTCNITATSTLCNDQHCGACGISNTGLDRRCIRKNINYQRFGHGFYLAPNSSKCHDYTQGCSSYRAMLLFDVCPGNKYNLKKNNEKLTGPPQGFDSVYGQTGGGNLNYEELVVYNADAALPKCIIVYQKNGEGKIAK